jgi:hypothetical protein
LWALQTLKTLVTGLCKTAILQGQILAMHSSVAVGLNLHTQRAYSIPLRGIQRLSVIPSISPLSFWHASTHNPYRKKNFDHKGVFVVSRKIVDTASKRNGALLHRHS